MPTKIEWCDETINPIVGCSKISSGCQNCYAEKMAWRLKRMGQPKYQDVVDRNGWIGRIFCDLRQFHSLPKKPRKVFVVSMGDLFFEKISDETIAMVFYAMRDYPQHTYIILTKRPDRMSYYLKNRITKGIKNLWLGVTAENQQTADERIPILLQIPASVRLVSVEPMLEEINIKKYLDPFRRLDSVYKANVKQGMFNKYQMASLREPIINWVIAGPETGPGARECKPEWIADLYEQCKAAGVPFFDKRKNYLAREFPKGA